MAQVTATAERTIDAPAQRVRSALADYTQVRPQILTPHFSGYRIAPDGRVHWRLAATEKRVREQAVAVEDGPGGLVERDANSSMVTTWTVEDAGPARCVVRVRSTWNGAGGIGGFFERRFAPPGLRRIYDGVLANLDTAVTAPPA